MNEEVGSPWRWCFEYIWILEAARDLKMVLACWRGSSWKPGCWNEAANRQIIDYSSFSACTAASHYQLSLNLWSPSASATVWEILFCPGSVTEPTRCSVPISDRRMRVRSFLFSKSGTWSSFSGCSLPGFVGRASAGPASWCGCWFGETTYCDLIYGVWLFLFLCFECSGYCFGLLWEFYCQLRGSLHCFISVASSVHYGEIVFKHYLKSKSARLNQSPIQHACQAFMI